MGFPKNGYSVGRSALRTSRRSLTVPSCHAPRSDASGGPSDSAANYRRISGNIARGVSNGVGITVGVNVGVLVGVVVGERVGVAVGELVDVTVGVSVGVPVGVAVGVSVAVGVAVATHAAGVTALDWQSPTGPAA